jgi:hypothetical protein
MSGPRPPEDGHPFPARRHLRQHEVQVVAGAGNCLAAAWTDDTTMTGMSGWICGYSVSLDNGRTWTKPLFHKRTDFAVTGNPSVAVGPDGVVFGVAMSVEADYASGIIELSISADAGRSWTEWKTIVAKRNGIPDRPRLLAAANGGLHLVFSSVEPTGGALKVLKSTIQHMRSMDQGEIWSEPHAISVERRRSRWFIDGYQGSAIAESPDGDVFVAWADYYGNGVSFSRSRNSGIDFDPPVRVRLKAVAGTSLLTWLLGATFGTPATELAVDASGRNVVITVHEAHAIGEIVLVGSQDEGRTWTRRAQLTRCGTNASPQFDPTGRLHVIWTELCDRRFDVLYAISSDVGYTFADSISLARNGAPVAVPDTTEAKEEFKAALGSYQSLVIDGGGTGSAFWVDLREGLTIPKLYESTWRV